jgi:AcrR family transcriptional regulator
MISMKIREIIVADRKDGMTVNAISLAVRVSESAIYRLFQKKQEPEVLSRHTITAARNPK